MSPMPRPSWAMYSSTPWPSASIIRRAACNWSPQSQRSEPKTSPVMHSECTRTRTSFLPSTSPFTSAMWCLPSTSDVYPTAVKSPNSVGSGTAAPRSTRRSVRRRCSIRSVMVIIRSPWRCA